MCASMSCHLLWFFRIRIPGTWEGSHIFGTDHYFSPVMLYASKSNKLKPHNSVKSLAMPCHGTDYMHIFSILGQVSQRGHHALFILDSP